MTIVVTNIIKLMTDAARNRTMSINKFLKKLKSIRLSSINTRKKQMIFDKNKKREKKYLKSFASND